MDSDLSLSPAPSPGSPSVFSPTPSTSLEEYEDTTDDHSTSSSSGKLKSPKKSWIPSDITWPDPHNPDIGTFPQSDFRNQRFKLYPVITEGPWVVKTAVRSCPCLLGQKVVQRYFRGDGYFETDTYVASSIIAKKLLVSAGDMPSISVLILV